MMSKLTKSSSAVGDWAPLGCAIFSGDVTNWEVEELKDGSRNGFLEVGRGGGSSKGERGSGEARLLGDAARLRKGLLDERLSDRPADGPVVVRWLDGWPISIANRRMLARSKRLITGGNDDAAGHCETRPEQMKQKLAWLSGTQSTRAPNPYKDNWARRFNRQLPN